MASWYVEYARPDLSGKVAGVVGDRGVVQVDGRLNEANARELAIEAARERGRERMGLTHYRMTRAHHLRDVPEALDVEWEPLPVYAPGSTPFGPEVEAKLNEIARITGRQDVYLFTDRPIEGGGKRDRYVFGPWLRHGTGLRNYAHYRMEWALEFIDAAHRVVTGSDAGPGAYEQFLPTGAAYVANEAAKREGVKVRRVVDVALVGNGFRQVTWQDTDGKWHLTEDLYDIEF